TDCRNHVMVYCRWLGVQSDTGQCRHSQDPITNVEPKGTVRQGRRHQISCLADEAELSAIRRKHWGSGDPGVRIQMLTLEGTELRFCIPYINLRVTFISDETSVLTD